MSDRTEASLVLVWGQMGKKLQNLDERRMMAVAQDDPNYFLAITANKEHLAIVEAMKIDEYIKNPKYTEGGDEPEYLKNPEYQPEKVKAFIRKVAAHDNLFREVSEFLHSTDDMLSVGSFLTGELKNRHAKLLITGDYDNDEI